MDFYFRRSYRGRLRAVIIDWAGSTVDYGCCAPAKVFLQVFEAKGVRITMEEARHPMGMHKRDHIRAIMEMPRVNELWRTVYLRAPNEQDISDLFDRFLPLQLLSLKDHSKLIPGALEAINFFRERHLKIGTTTGYTRKMMEVVMAEAKRQGYEPDLVVCADEVPKGRPSPFMCFENAKKLGIYPMESMVKIGDTRADIEEGLNAGMWTIGLARSGNEMGLSEEEEHKLSDDDRARRITSAETTLASSGAHYVVDNIGDATSLIDAINARLRAGERP